MLIEDGESGQYTHLSTAEWISVHLKHGIWHEHNFQLTNLTTCNDQSTNVILIIIY